MKLTKFRKTLLIAAVALAAVPGLSGPVQAEAQDHADSSEICYWAKNDRTLKSLVGVKVAETTLVGGWCIQDGNVTEASVLDTSSAAFGFFNSVVDEPQLNEGSEIIDNEARVYKQFKFVSSIGNAWFNIDKHTYTCSRIIGTSLPTVSGDKQCTAY